jgi:hypothetical protein
MSATASLYPTTDHLWQLGFTLSFEVERLAVPFTQGDHTFVTQCRLTVTPDRGEARRHFGRKGQMRGEVVSNVPLELFGKEKDEGRTDLKDRYTERCAKSVFEALQAEVPALPKPAVSHVPV